MVVVELSSSRLTIFTAGNQAHPLNEPIPLEVGEKARIESKSESIELAAQGWGVLVALDYLVRLPIDGVADLSDRKDKMKGNVCHLPGQNSLRIHAFYEPVDIKFFGVPYPSPTDINQHIELPFLGRGVHAVASLGRIKTMVDSTINLWENSILPTVQNSTEVETEIVLVAKRDHRGRNLLGIVSLVTDQENVTRATLLANEKWKNISLTDKIDVTLLDYLVNHCATISCILDQPDKLLPLVRSKFGNSDGIIPSTLFDAFAHFALSFELDPLKPIGFLNDKFSDHGLIPTRLTESFDLRNRVPPRLAAIQQQIFASFPPTSSHI